MESDDSDSYKGEMLLESKMFIGAKVYPRPPKRKPWYGYLYIATFTERNKLKIGISADYAARDMQLRLKNETKDSAKIYYLFGRALLCNSVC